MLSEKPAYANRISKLLSAATDFVRRKNVPDQAREKDLAGPLAESHHTANGNPIEAWFHSEWHCGGARSDGHRKHVGRSAEGYHGGLEIGAKEREGAFHWSPASPSEGGHKVSHYKWPLIGALTA